MTDAMASNCPLFMKVPAPGLLATIPCKLQGPASPPAANCGSPATAQPSPVSGRQAVPMLQAPISHQVPDLLHDVLMQAGAS